MGWFDGFPFKSKAQMEKEQKAFENRVFPLGLPQRDAAAQVLREVLGSKVSKEELLFGFICAKDAYTEADEPDQALTHAKIALRKQKIVPVDQINCILALLLLEKDVSTLEDYPTAEMVRQKEQDLRAETT